MRPFRLTFALALGLLIALPAAAQPRHDADRAEQRLERRVEQLDRRLDLTDAQEAAIKQHLQTQHEAARAWHEAHPDATHEERRAHRQTQQAAHRAALENLLTPAQRQQLETLKAQRPDRGERRMHRRGRQAHRLADALELTESQRTQLRDLTQAQREEAKAWRAANPEATRAERQARHEAHRTAMEDALRQVLTPEQQTKLEALKADRAQKQRTKRQDRRRGDDAPGQNAQAAPQPDRFALSNYPNPFNPSTEIRFTLPATAHATLAVYDLQGREVARLVDGTLSAGPHAVSFTATDLPTGTYLYRLTAGDATSTGRMLLVK